MPRAGSIWLRSAVVCLCLLHTGAYTSNASVTLPNWRPNAEYVLQCDSDSGQSLFCDWTTEWIAGSHTATVNASVDVIRLESGLLNVSQESCLEFWYQKPGQDPSEHRVLLKKDEGETLVWTSPNADSDSWRQVFVPLSFTEEANIQLIFERTEGLPEEESVVFDRIGVRSGQCGSQCQSGSSFWTDRSTRCTCSSGQLLCAAASCPDGETCGQVDSSNQTNIYGTCSVDSDPRYTTFDGVNFRFVGPCTYVLAKVCDNSELLPTFVVEAQNEKRGDSSISSIQRVNVNIQGLRVSMLKRDRHRVMVNGIWKSLPVSLSRDAITIVRNRSLVLLETNFGLMVSYSRRGAVKVTVPDVYSNKLCGMCGNFNHIPDDDYARPNGSQSEDAQVLGLSWTSPDAPCDAPVLPRECPAEEELEYASEVHCGVLLSQDGPFAACLNELSTEKFHRNCVYDMCASHGDQEILCDSLQIFAETCQKAGIILPAWRNSSLCPLVCGENSHYNACASGCPESCSALDAPEVCGTCEERCECDDGFMLSAGRCVPAEDCGCWVDGQHYERGMTFMDTRCERTCECAGMGNVLCSATSCTANEICTVRDGVRGCFPSDPVTCHVYGDPHYVTFDGKAYSFRGTCNYTIAKTCGPSQVQFSITARNEGRDHTSSSFLNSVALEVQGFHIAIRRSKMVYVNGDLVNLPVTLNTSVTVFQKNPYVQVDTMFGLRVLFDGDSNLFVQVDERYRGETCGLCGTYSDSQFDDFVTPDGDTIADKYLFASSWNANDEEWSCSNGSPTDPECSPEVLNEARVECSSLYGDVFSACHFFVPPQIYVDSCVSDHCATEGDLVQLCTSLEAYEAACQMAEVDLGDWKNSTVCARLPPTDPPTTPPPPASCPLNCNFDRDECGWEQLVQDSFDWTRWSGSTPTDHSGPTGDHTTGSGHYMYTEGDGVYHGDSARMISPLCQAPGTHCLSFWYHMFGQATAMKLSVYLIEHETYTKIWTKSDNQGDLWHKAEVQVTAEGPFQILVEGIRGSSNLSDMALDDVAITFGECKGSTSTDVPSTLIPLVTNGSPSVCNFGCNFDEDLCAWSQTMTDSFDWTWQNGSTPTLMTGPSYDHTSGSGRYLYIEADGRYNGDAARLLSPVCSDLGIQCLQFWYHMYGSADNMELKVSLVQDGETLPLWGRRNDRGDTWHRGRVDFHATRPFQVVFEGRRGTSEFSDVAIDDISLHRGLCSDLLPPVVHTTAQQPDLISTLPPEETVSQDAGLNSTSSSFVRQSRRPHPVCSIACDFENDICSWNQLLTDVFDWTRQQGSTPTPLTGPSTDHTSGSGHYLYIEGNEATNGDTARLLSSECPDPVPQCLEFWYHMYGSADTMGLTVYLLQGSLAQSVWSMRNNQGDLWHRALVDLRPEENFRIIFEGRRGTDDRSDVAVDDISLYRGTCADIALPGPTTVRPPQTTVRPYTPAPTTDRPPQTTVRPETPAPTTVRPLQTTVGPETPAPTTVRPPQSTVGPETPAPTTVRPPQTTVGPDRPAPTTVRPPQTTAGPETPAPTTVRPTTQRPTRLPPTNTPTTLPPQASCPLNCNFDRDECGWEQLVQDSFDWTRWSGSTPTDLSGPNGDHTTGSGHYMYTEGDGVYHGDSARMISPPCQAPGTHCLSFWYHMFGQAVDMKLSVYQVEHNTYTKIWTKSNNQGDLWHKVEVQITAEGPFQISVEGIRGSSALSDMAWDDVAITFGECKGSSIPDPGPTDPHPVCNLGCSFDHHLCAWSQMMTDSFDWTWQNGSTPTLMTGPSYDHTSGSGGYLYIEADGRYNGDTARLVSSECPDPVPQCLEFWYHMYGTADTMGLTVYLLQGSLAQSVWSMRNNQGDLWHRALVDLRPEENFQIIFEGRRGTDDRSDVAVDDISLYRGTCADIPPPGPATTTTVRPPQTTVRPGTPAPTTVRPPQTTVAPETPAPTTVRPETPAPTTVRPPQTTVRPETPAPTTVRPPQTTVAPETPAPTTVRPPQTTVRPETPAPTTVRPPQSTVAPETPASTTVRPPQTTVRPETPAPTTVRPPQTTVRPETPAPTTVRPPQTTVAPETPAPTTVSPPQTTVGPETPAPTTVKPPQTTVAPETPAPTTVRPPQTTVRPETPAPTTVRPPQTTVRPETPAPTTVRPPQTTVRPETPAPTTVKPPQTTVAPETPAPTTVRPPQTTVRPETPAPTTVRPPQTTAAPETPAPTTVRPPQTTVRPETPAPTTVRPPQTTAAPETPAPTTVRPPQTTVRPETSAPTTVRPPQTTVAPETPAPTTVRPPQTTVRPETPAPTTVRPPQTTVRPETSAPTTVRPPQTTVRPETPRPTPSCPRNSHYTDCMPACQPTCKHLHGQPDCNADEPCVQGCVCDDGFILKKRTCVPIRECGCQDDQGNKYYFDQVWYEDHCSRRCECEEEDGRGEIECDEEYECDDDDVCLMDEDGQFSCVSTDFSECSVDDDSEYRTFDDMKHEFEGEHSYVLVQTTRLPQNLPDVYVVGINKVVSDQDSDKDHDDDDDDDNSSSRSDEDSDEDDDSEEHGSRGRLREMKIRVYNHTVVFKKNRKVVVDGAQVRLPVSPSAGLKIREHSSRLYLTTDFGLTVEFNGKGKAEIVLPHTYKKKVGGLCGNFDGKKKNDMMKPDGEQAKSEKEFGESWRVTEERLFIRRKRSTLLRTITRA